MKKILVVEDDPLLNKTLSYNLKADGYEVKSVFTKASAIKALEQVGFALIVLDINLPDGNGFDLCKKIKEENDVSILFLTAKDMEEDMIKGYELGADDYVTKPFSMAVLRKKIMAMLNRLSKQKEKDFYEDGSLVINFTELFTKYEGESLLLTPMEYRALKIFVQNPKTILTRELLLEKLWDKDGNFVDEHTLTTMISRIRSKIEKKGSQYIKTVYGMGYMWVGEKIGEKK